jgi:hypothetical protein
VWCFYASMLFDNDDLGLVIYCMWSLASMSRMFTCDKVEDAERRS